jgi:hypothetical protein
MPVRRKRAGKIMDGGQALFDYVKMGLHSGARRQFGIRKSRLNFLSIEVGD